MKNKELFTALALGGLFSLAEISGEHENTSDDFKKFSNFTLDLDVEGKEERTLISFTREQYDGIYNQAEGQWDTTQWRVNFKVDQLTEGVLLEDLIAALQEHEDAVIDAINEFIDDYESQNFD